MTQTSNESLLAQYADGDFSAFEQLYQRNKGGVYRYLQRQVHDAGVVDDLFQEVWSKVVSHANRQNHNASFTTWLYTIARNKLIDHIRHVQVVNRVIDSNAKPFEENENDIEAKHTESNSELAYIADHGISPENTLSQLEQAKAIDYCMKKLPKHQLDCFLLKEEAGFTAATIADITGITLEAAKSRLKACYKNLRACLTTKLELAMPTQKHEKGET